MAAAGAGQPHRLVLDLADAPDSTRSTPTRLQAALAPLKPQPPRQAAQQQVDGECATAAGSASAQRDAPPPDVTAAAAAATRKAGHTPESAAQMTPAAGVGMLSSMHAHAATPLQDSVVRKETPRPSAPASDTGRSHHTDQTPGGRPAAPAPVASLEADAPATAGNRDAQPAAQRSAGASLVLGSKHCQKMLGGTWRLDTAAPGGRADSAPPTMPLPALSLPADAHSSGLGAPPASCASVGGTAPMHAVLSAGQGPFMRLQVISGSNGKHAVANTTSSAGLGTATGVQGQHSAPAAQLSARPALSAPAAPVMGGKQPSRRPGLIRRLQPAAAAQRSEGGPSAAPSCSASANLNALLDAAAAARWAREDEAAAPGGPPTMFKTAPGPQHPCHPASPGAQAAAALLGAGGATGTASIFVPQWTGSAPGSGGHTHNAWPGQRMGPQGFICTSPPAMASIKAEPGAEDADQHAQPDAAANADQRASGGALQHLQTASSLPMLPPPQYQQQQQVFWPQSGSSGGFTPMGSGHPTPYAAAAAPPAVYAESLMSPFGYWPNASDSAGAAGAAGVKQEAAAGAPPAGDAQDAGSRGAHGRASQGPGFDRRSAVFSPLSAAAAAHREELPAERHADEGGGVCEATHAHRARKAAARHTGTRRKHPVAGGTKKRRAAAQQASTDMDALQALLAGTGASGAAAGGTSAVGGAKGGTAAGCEFDAVINAAASAVSPATLANITAAAAAAAAAGVANAAQRSPAAALPTGPAAAAIARVAAQAALQAAAAATADTGLASAAAAAATAAANAAAIEAFESYELMCHAGKAPCADVSSEDNDSSSDGGYDDGAMMMEEEDDGGLHAALAAGDAVTAAGGKPWLVLQGLLGHDGARPPPAVAPPAARASWAGAAHPHSSSHAAQQHRQPGASSSQARDSAAQRASASSPSSAGLQEGRPAPVHATGRPARGQHRAAAALVEAPADPLLPVPVPPQPGVLPMAVVEVAHAAQRQAGSDAPSLPNIQHRSSRGRRWQVYLSAQSLKYLYIGLYNTLEEAVFYRDLAILAVHGRNSPHAVTLASESTYTDADIEAERAHLAATKPPARVVMAANGLLPAGAAGQRATAATSAAAAAAAAAYQEELQAAAAAADAAALRMGLKAEAASQPPLAPASAPQQEPKLLLLQQQQQQQQRCPAQQHGQKKAAPRKPAAAGAKRAAHQPAVAAPGNHKKQKVAAAAAGTPAAAAAAAAAVGPAARQQPRSAGLDAIAAAVAMLSAEDPAAEATPDGWRPKPAAAAAPGGGAGCGVPQSLKGVQRRKPAKPAASQGASSGTVPAAAAAPAAAGQQAGALRTQRSGAAGAAAAAAATATAEMPADDAVNGVAAMCGVGPPAAARKLGRQQAAGAAARTTGAAAAAAVAGSGQPAGVGGDDDGDGDGGGGGGGGGDDDGGVSDDEASQQGGYVAEGTGIHGVRLRRGKYEAFLAGCFRYLYVGQFATKAAALAARNAALLAVYGPQVARLHGVSDPDRCSDEEVRAMAAKLRKKAGVAEVMQRHGRLHAAPTGAAAAATTGPAAAAGSRQ